MVRDRPKLQRGARALALALLPLALGAQPAEPAPKATPAPTPALEGTVKGPDGKPAEKAVVAARSATTRWDDPPVTTQTDAQGRFRLVTGGRATHSLRVEVKGLAAQMVENLKPGFPIGVTLSKGGAPPARSSCGSPRTGWQAASPSRCLPAARWRPR